MAGANNEQDDDAYASLLKAAELLSEGTVTASRHAALCIRRYIEAFDREVCGGFLKSHDGVSRNVNSKIDELCERYRGRVPLRELSDFKFYGKRKGMVEMIEEELGEDIDEICNYIEERKRGRARSAS